MSVGSVCRRALQELKESFSVITPFPPNMHWDWSPPPSVAADSLASQLVDKHVHMHMCITRCFDYGCPFSRQRQMCSLATTCSFNLSNTLLNVYILFKNSNFHCILVEFHNRPTQSGLRLRSGMKMVNGFWNVEGQETQQEKVAGKFNTVWGYKTIS